MTDIEIRLRDALAADAGTVRPGTIRPFDENAARPAVTVRRSRSGSTARTARFTIPLTAAMTVAAVVLGLVLVVPRVWPNGRPRPTRPFPTAGPVLRPLQSFLTVSTSSPVIRGDYLIRYPVATLDLRSVRGGPVIAILLRSLGSISAAMTRDGSVIAVVDYGCRSQVLRIDPRTGRRTLIRVLPQSASDIALSPDGRELAYLTYPASDHQGCGTTRQPARPVRIQFNPGGVAQYGPSVLAVVNLATGAVASAWTGNEGDTPSGPAWSPDGTRIAVVLGGSILTMPAARPSFATAQRLRPSRGCGYVATTWTTAGVLGVLGCGRQSPALSPRTLLRLPAAGGQPTASWRLPACIDGISLLADPTARHVLIQADLGYGNGPSCGNYHTWTSRVAEIRGSKLVTVAVFPQNGGTNPQVTGW